SVLCRPAVECPAVEQRIAELRRKNFSGDDETGGADGGRCHRAKKKSPEGTIQRAHAGCSPVRRSIKTKLAADHANSRGQTGREELTHPRVSASSAVFYFSN